MRAAAVATALLSLPARPSAGAALRVRRFAPAEDPGRFDTEMDNAYVTESAALSANTTALLLIDVWNDDANPVLAENERERLRPLLDAAREAGLLIVHAPSEGAEWRNISVRPGELLVTGEDGRGGSASRCDAPLAAHGVTHVLVAGYDTNYCVVDKPCGAVALSTQLQGRAELILVRDATRPEPRWLGNLWYGAMLATNMIEAAPWLPPGQRFIRSAVVADVLDAFSVPRPLAPLQYPQPDAAQTHRPPAPVPPLSSGAALVVVSCSVDWANDGFRARVAENIATQVGPLVDAARQSRAVAVLHVPNGHAPAPGCAPAPGEPVLNTTEAFDAEVARRGVTTLLYAGYAANRDMLFGVAGMQRYYSNARYLHQPVPNYFWIREATLGFEIPESIEGGWAAKVAMAYRQPSLPVPLAKKAGNVLSAPAVVRRLCALAPGNGVIYSLEGTRNFSSAADAIIDTDVDGGCGGASMLGRGTVTIDLYAAPASLKLADRKLLCFRKTVGTPYAVYQLRAGDDAPGQLYYQVAAADWATIKVADFFRAVNETVRVTVIHDGGEVRIFRNGALVSKTEGFQQLDYSDAEAMVVGWRKGEEFWEGTIGPVLIRPGIFEPGGGNGTGRLAVAELAALHDIWNQCGGSQWQYQGTDVVGKGGRWMVGDPCVGGWYGVKCDGTGEHVLQLFPNTHNSGNPLVCQLPSSIGNLTHLEHLYTSNDQSQSYLQGSIPETLGDIKSLKCIYFSHNNLTLPFPRSLERLSNLQVFLSRANHIPGPLPDFSKMPLLRNVWFDGNELEGDLGALGHLPALTFLEAANNRLTGAVPASLCSIKCSAGGNGNLTCPAALPKGCCGIGSCGGAPPAPAPPPASMGECFPQ